MSPYTRRRPSANPLGRGAVPTPPVFAHRCRSISILLAGVGVFLAASPALAQIDIDSFSDAVPQTAQPNTEVAAAVLGGFRDVKSNNASNTATADAGRFTCAGTAAFQGCTVQYDGFDGDPTNFTPGGFAATDLTAGGQDRILVPTYVATGSCNLFFQICDDDTPDPQCESMSVGGIVNGDTVVFAYDDFDPGLDFTAVTALQVNLTPVSSPVDCSFGPLVTGGPLFADGFESGDTSAWTQAVP